jgi:hypothetical protein
MAPANAQKSRRERRGTRGGVGRAGSGAAAPQQGQNRAASSIAFLHPAHSRIAPS